MRSSAVVHGIFALAALLAGAAGTAATEGVAHADVQHTIGRGHTVEAIANRYHVTAKAIIEANHLKDLKHLKVGDVLVIPGVKDPSTGAGASAASAAGAKKPDAKEAKAEDLASHKKGERSAKVGAAPGRETTTFAMKPKTPGVIHVHRVATQESFDIDVGDRKGRVSPVTLKTFEKMMRAPGGMAHPIEPRLVALLGVMSNHFGSRKLEVVSGFRPFTPTQYNPHSNHMHGKAVDFRVAGVPNEAVRDFCRTLRNVGCGYYPNSVFVHMDVREQSAFWIDYSKPGETPRYNAPDANADEGTSDVNPEAAPAPASTNATDTAAPAQGESAPAAPSASPPAEASPYGDTGGN